VCEKTEDSTYLVTAQGKQYVVDPEVGTYTCTIGKDGAPCKHQFAVIVQFNLHSDSFLPPSDRIGRRQLFFIATGKMLADHDTWCSPLVPSTSQGPHTAESPSSTQYLSPGLSTTQNSLLCEENEDHEQIQSLLSQFHSMNKVC
jgi:hypothetical protein